MPRNRSEKRSPLDPKYKAFRGIIEANARGCIEDSVAPGSHVVWWASDRGDKYFDSPRMSDDLQNRWCGLPNESKGRLVEAEMEWQLAQESK